MGLFSKDIKNLEDLYQHGLKDIYYAENQIVKSLPDMIEKVTDPQLKQGFETHLTETKGHVKRLEQVFKSIGETPKGKTCDAIMGILDTPPGFVTGGKIYGRPEEAYLIAAVAYFFICFALSWVVKRLNTRIAIIR